MKKYCQVPLIIEVAAGDGSTRVEVSPEATNEFCLCLNLLDQSLVEACIFQSGRSALEFIVVDDADAVRLVSQSRERTVWALDKNSLAYLTRFFLEYYRDAAAAVDHLDLEAKTGSYLTIQLTQWRAPLSKHGSKHLDGSRSRNDS